MRVRVVDALGVVAVVVAWLVISACVDAPLTGGPPAARVIAAWDPLQCGPPHRVAIQLARDRDGPPSLPVGASAPCALGELVLDVPDFGEYRGVVRGGAPSPVAVPIDLVVDEPVVRWTAEVPL